jgi:hypothetical protein
MGAVETRHFVSLWEMQPGFLGRTDHYTDLATSAPRKFRSCVGVLQHVVSEIICQTDVRLRLEDKHF